MLSNNDVFSFLHSFIPVWENGDRSKLQKWKRIRTVIYR